MRAVSSSPATRNSISASGSMSVIAQGFPVQPNRSSATAVLVRLAHVAVSVTGYLRLARGRPDGPGGSARRYPSPAGGGIRACRSGRPQIAVELVQMRTDGMPAVTFAEHPAQPL